MRYRVGAVHLSRLQKRHRPQLHIESCAFYSCHDCRTTCTLNVSPKTIRYFYRTMLKRDIFFRSLRTRFTFARTTRLSTGIYACVRIKGHVRRARRAREGYTYIIVVRSRRTDRRRFAKMLIAHERWPVGDGVGE